MVTFVTNTKYDCERFLNRDKKRAERRVNFGPKGPVYVNHMKEPIMPQFELERRENSLFGRIKSFFTVSAPETLEADENYIPNNISEGDIALLRSLAPIFDNGVDLPNDEILESPQLATSKADGKRGILNSEFADSYDNPVLSRGDIDEIGTLSILDLKDQVEAEARLQNYLNRKQELLELIEQNIAALPDVGAFGNVSMDALRDLDNKELEDILGQAKSQVWAKNLKKVEFSKKQWAETEEYLLFSNDIDVKDFIVMVNASGKDIINPVEVSGLLDWALDKNAQKADWRYGNDIVHNWNLTNLKCALVDAYKISCEDGGMLDHDPFLNFPNGTQTRLSRFIGKDAFDEIAEPDAFEKDMTITVVESTALKSA